MTKKYVGIWMLLVFLSGCAGTPKLAEILTKPLGAELFIDGNKVGVSPLSYEFSFASGKIYEILAKKEGYFSEKKTVKSTFDLGTINLAESPLWVDTATSPAANEWLLLIVDGKIDSQDVWQRMVDAVTKRFPDLEEFDYQSGYIKSSIKAKRYSTQRGEFRLRSKFIATITEEEPLTYKIKLVSEWTDKGLNWYTYPRAFIEDAQLIEELVDRFSVL